MRTHLSPQLEKTANTVSKIPFIKACLKPFYYWYKKRVSTNRFECLHTNGIRVLKEFDQIMVNNSINYTVYAGTLLGAIREGGMLKHDFDIDTAIWDKDYTPTIESALKKGGFKLTRRFEVDGGKLGREDTYEKDGVDIDIFYIYCDKNGTYNTDYHSVNGCANFYDSMKKYGHVNVRRCNLPIKYETRRIPFDGIYVSAMLNAEEWLAARYGKNYMIPNPNYHDSGDEFNIYYWKNELATYKYFREQ